MLTLRSYGVGSKYRTRYSGGFTSFLKPPCSSVRVILSSLGNAHVDYPLLDRYDWCGNRGCCLQRLAIFDNNLF